jgi:hypothetical protein
MEISFSAAAESMLGAMLDVIRVAGETVISQTA